jgi:hypothetical protein
VTGLVIGLSGLVLVLVTDVLHPDWILLGEGRPDLTPEGILRTFVVAVLVAIVCWSAVRLGRSGGRFMDDTALGRLEAWSVVGVLLLSLVFTSLFVFAPTAFYSLSLEDGPVEWVSFALLMGACAVFAACLFRCRRGNTLPWYYPATMAAFALLFFVIGMEEVSWLQRVLGFDQLALRGNNQAEFNLHNLATSPTENAYYLGAFVLLAAVPFVRSLGLLPTENRYVRTFAARTPVLLVAAMAWAYNYDMWNILFTQVAFFGTVGMLTVLAVYSPQAWLRTLAILSLVALVGTQLVLLTSPENHIRGWAVTEYKELFIPAGFLAYALGVRASLREGS